MSSQSFANLANSEFNGNIVLNNPNSYIQFPDGSQQFYAGGGAGGDVFLNALNTYTNTSVNDFEAAEITCFTQPSGDNSTFVATTAFVQTELSTAVFTDQDNTFEVGFTQTFNGSVDITSYTSSNIIGQPILSSTPTITDSILLGNFIGNPITNINGTVAIGNGAAYNTNTNTNGIALGKNSDLGTGATNNIAIGYGAISTGDNCIVIGSSISSSVDNEILLGNGSNYINLYGNNTSVVGYSSITNNGSSSTTSWSFTTGSIPRFNILLATNITSLLPLVYTGSYNLIPQFYNFTISSQILQNTSVNSIFTATNPNAQTQPINFTGLYATGINTIVNSLGALSGIEPTDFGSAFFNNVNTNTFATTSPYFPTITGTCYLNITTQWDGTDYIVYTTYDFQEINMSPNTTFSVGFSAIDSIYYQQQIDIGYTGSLSTPILLQLSIK